MLQNIIPILNINNYIVVCTLNIYNTYNNKYYYRGKYFDTYYNIK